MFCKIEKYLLRSKVVEKTRSFLKIYLPSHRTMAENLPNNDDILTEVNFITQDYVQDYSVIAKVVTDSTKKKYNASSPGVLLNGFFIQSFTWC